MIDLSIVIATRNRFQYLPQAIESAWASAEGLAVETVIVDGGSTDGTLEYLRGKKGIHLIEQGKMLGCVRAFNAGFQVCSGRHVFNGNDDMLVVGKALYNASKMLDDSDTAGQIAIAYSHPGVDVPECSMMGLDRRKVVYANFGVTMKCLGDKIGWWGDYLYRYAGDNHLSASVYDYGCEIVELPVALGHIVHFQADDATRVNSPKDTTRFYGYWSKFRW